ncbi:MAG: hypothetical protein ABII82_15830 [Verrucomicrobiota bacterium]
MANPYNTPIAGKTYNARVIFGADSHLSTFVGDSQSSFWRMSLRNLFEGAIFEIQCPDLSPGQAIVFTLKTDNDPWVPEKTYELEPGWSDFSITLNTNDHGGTPFDETVIYNYPDPADPGKTLKAKGVHPVFGDSSAPSSITWGTSSPGPRMSSSNGGPSRGGTLDWALTDTDNTIFQRIEILGYSANPVSTYGIRGTGIAMTGVSYLRLSNVGDFTNTLTLPYYSQFNWRAPLISRTGYYGSKINALGSWNLSFQQDFDQKIRLTNPLDSDDARVEWNGVVGNTASIALARSNWQPFDIPRDKVSIGQLQHFNAGGYNDGLVYPVAKSPLPSRPSSNGNWRPRYIAPAYAIGNSRANPHVAPDGVKKDDSAVNNQPYYDFSYLLNRAIFDGYFFSTYPQTGNVDLAADRLPNPRLHAFRDDVDTDSTADFRGGSTFNADDVFLAARNLINEGSFNVNSTSVAAWTALLSSLRNPEASLDNPFPRSVNQPGGTANAGDGVSENAWNGFRDLTNAQITTLAAEIVDQIKQRGISVSLADFINRRLNATTPELNYMGPLQAALDATSTINNGFPNSVPNAGTGTINLIAPADSQAGGNDFYHYPEHAAKHGMEGIAGWLSQGDVVQALAPVLSARSDTFRIRTYGETRNPVTNDVTGRAWCEAIVQRLPDYVVEGDDAIQLPSTLSADSQRFGRKFAVIDFRWLRPEDI